MRNPFRKSHPITEAVFERWLRAQRPPLDWFAELEPAEQEVFAGLGDDHAEDLIVATGFAVQDPEKVRLGLAATDGDPEAEEALTVRRAEAMAARLQAAQNGSRSTPAPELLSMGGLGKRRREAQQRREDSNVAPTLFGKAADQPQEAAE